MLGRDPTHSCPANKGRGLRVLFAPTVQLGRENRKVQREGISQPRSGAAGWAEVAQSRELKTLSTVRAVDWEPDGQELST